MRKLIIVSFLLGTSCGGSNTSNPVPSNTSTTSTDCPTGQIRIGANCKDGTTSTATGSGACSSHGGVSSWICK